jgi:hypothetical protein
MFNWYIPQELKTIAKWIGRMGWMIVLGACAGAVGVMFNAVRTYYGY